MAADSGTNRATGASRAARNTVEKRSWKDCGPGRNGIGQQPSRASFPIIPFHPIARMAADLRATSDKPGSQRCSNLSQKLVWDMYARRNREVYSSTFPGDYLVF